MITNIHSLWQNKDFVPHVSPVASLKILVCHIRLGLLFPRVLLVTFVFVYIIHVLFRPIISTATWAFEKKIYLVTFIYCWCIIVFHYIVVYFFPHYSCYSCPFFHITFLRGLFCMTSWLLRWRSYWRAIISCFSLQGVHWLIAKIWNCVTDVLTRSAFNSDSYITRRKVGLAG